MSLFTFVMLCFGVAVIIGGILFILKIERNAPVVKDDEDEPLGIGGKR